MTNHPTLLDWFEKPSVRREANSDALRWDKVSMVVARSLPTEDFYPSPDLDETTMVVPFHGMMQAEVRGGIFPTTAKRKLLVAGMLNVVPPGALYEARWNGSVTAGFYSLSQRALIETVASVVQGDPAGVHIRPLLSFWDSQLHQWCSAIRDEFEQPAQYGSLYVDALTQAIIIHLLRHYSNTPRVEVRAPGKLSEQQQRQVQDYIATHLDQPLTVGELAGLLSLSTAHFDKLFRTTFQQAPYQYVLTQRVERAKALLRDERKTLFEVARECGFANQSHFTRHFKAIARVTPGRYARSRRASVMKTDKTRL